MQNCTCIILHCFLHKSLCLKFLCRKLVKIYAGKLLKFLPEKLFAYSVLLKYIFNSTPTTDRKDALTFSHPHEGRWSITIISSSKEITLIGNWLLCKKNQIEKHPNCRTQGCRTTPGDKIMCWFVRTKAITAEKKKSKPDVDQRGGESRK